MGLLNKILFLAISVMIFNISFSQNICLGSDTTVCVGSPVSISNCGTGSTNPTPFALNNPAQGTFGDDDYAAAVPMGFNFTFYGNTYNQIVVGDNGIMSFDVSNSMGYCPYSTVTLPATSPTQIFNSVCLAWQDLYFPAGGTYFYETIGTAPNRMFIVFYESIQYFSSSCQAPEQCFTAGVVFFESSNRIEMHISSKLSCTAWNNGLAVQGLLNSTGTIANIVPGRNNSVWTAQMDGQRFDPAGPSNYTITPIPFQLISVPNSTNTVWENTLGQSFPYNNGVLNIASAEPDSVGYFISSATCGVGVGSISDTTWIIGLNSTVSVTGTDDFCSAGFGTVTAMPTDGIPPFTFDWPALGSQNQNVNGLFAGTYTVNMIDSMGCSSTASVTIGDSPATYSSSSTFVSCPGGNDGTATANMSPALGNLTYSWSDPLSQTTQTAFGLSAGTYNCTITSDIGCLGTTTVTVSEIPSMIFTDINQSDVTCYTGSDGMVEVIVEQGTPPYSYSWDHSGSNSNIANDLYVGSHMVTVTDANGCITSISTNLIEPSPLLVDLLTPDTLICPESSLILTALGSGGSTPYTFTWYENGKLIGEGLSILVDPDSTNAVYCVEISEECGSPIAQDCNLVTFPTPIIPHVTPDQFSKCEPATFELFNTSQNGIEIASTYWDFMNLHYMTETGNDSLTYYYTTSGLKSIAFTVTSIYGCVYSDTLDMVLEVLPKPNAEFTFSSNPTTIFETEIMMQDKSSLDVIDWEWYSAGSSPSTSKQEYPIFKFPEGVEGNYEISLIVTNQSGCIDTITHELNVIQDILFFSPNSFTPDDDEFNQAWRPYVQGIDIYHFDLYIFNRWGEVVWESHNPDEAWDGNYNGKPVQSGTYVWTAKVKNPNNDEKVEFNGFINVIR